jgi:hypothetical protein
MFYKLLPIFCIFFKKDVSATCVLLNKHTCKYYIEVFFVPLLNEFHRQNII